MTQGSGEPAGTNGMSRDQRGIRGETNLIRDQSTLVQSTEATETRLSQGSRRNFKLEIGSHLDPMVDSYELIRPLGRGGMGQVFLARDTRLGRLVAIKFLTSKSDVSAQRFVAEARATAQFDHPNVVAIHDAGEHRGHPYMVLQYVKGQSLKEWLDQRKRARLQQKSVPTPADKARLAVPATTQTGLSPSRIAELMIPVVRALVHAHELGIVHRDLNPCNIMITDTGVVKVLDFGIAKIMGAIESTPGQPDEHAEVSQFTQAGRIIGTRAYMSPEQLGADTVDDRTDVWAVGLLLYKLAFGTNPQESLPLNELPTVADLSVPMPSASEQAPELGKLATIIDRCLIKRKADRIGSAREVLAELETVASPRSAPYRHGEEPEPYPGLAAFQESDAERFFGRDQAVGEVISRLADQPMVAIVGPSGVGKSSFVRAGVIPALKRADQAWQAFVIRPGPHPLAGLAELLLRSFWRTAQHGCEPVLPKTSDTTETLVSERSSTESSDQPKAVKTDSSELNRLDEREPICRRLQDEPGYLGAQLRDRARRKLTRILLFVDQFEELYTLADAAQRDVFLACLTSVADEVGSPLRVIVSLRSDFLDSVAENHETLPKFSRGIALLSPMTRNDMRDALLRPLAATEYRFEDRALVDELLDSLEHTAGALPLLQFTAAKLWHHRDTSRHQLTWASYRALGGVAGALAGHADAVLSAMSAGEKQWTRSLFLRLVTPERTRTLATVNELRQCCGRVATKFDPVLDHLIDARLLTVTGSGGADKMVEIVHESLINQWPTLAGWLTDNEEDIAFLARLHHAADEWQKNGRVDDLLWRGRAAQDAQNWYERYQGESESTLSPLEERYVVAVLALDQRARRHRHCVALGVFALLGVLAVVLSYLTIRAESEAARAEREALRAESEAIRSRNEAIRARNASRVAAAEAARSDPTTVLALLREVEPGAIPASWSGLVRWALSAGVAHTVLPIPAYGNAVAFSPDGTRIVLAGLDRTVRVLRADGGGEFTVFRGHTATVNSAAFGPDGSRIVSASDDRTARVWRSDGSGEPVVLRGHAARLASVGFSPDGARIVSASEDRTVRVWPADGSGEVRILRGHSSAVHSAAFSPDGTRIVSASADRTVTIWSLDGRSKPRILRGHTDAVRSAEFSPDGTRIVSGSEDHTVRIWSIDGSLPAIVMRGHSDVVTSARFSPDGALVVSTSQDRTVRLWRADGTELFVLRGHRDIVVSADFSPDGKRIVSTGDPTVRIWRIPGAKSVVILRGHTGPVGAAEFSPDGARIVSCGDKTVRVWPADGKGEPLVLRGHTDIVRSAEFSPDGHRIVSASWDRTVRLWSADGKGEPITLRGHTDTLVSAVFSPDGKRIMSSAWDKTVRLWPVDGSDGPGAVTVLDEAPAWTDFSPDGTRIVSGLDDMTVRAWRVDGSGEPIILRGHTAPVLVATFSPDGSRIASASEDRTIRVWPADGTEQPHILRGHTGEVYSVEFSPDGTRLVSASADTSVRLWSVDGSGEPIILRGHMDGVLSADFSPDGTRIVSASWDKTIRIWNNLTPIRPTDTALWTETTFCLSIERRQALLGVTKETALANYKQCLERVIRARQSSP
ncbi:MAG: protein kinase [Proteobacteria bacterium]|nr:protein kinase [Pseudomonadota bacterium]